MGNRSIHALVNPGIGLIFTFRPIYVHKLFDNAAREVVYRAFETGKPLGLQRCLKPTGWWTELAVPKNPTTLQPFGSHAAALRALLTFPQLPHIHLPSDSVGQYVSPV